MYRNIKKYEVKFTDADAFDNLKPSSLLSFMEESACLSADELGFGYEAISPKNLGFVVVNYYIRLERPVKLGEELEIHTWPLKPRHLIFFRDFELYVKGKKVGAGTTRWCMVDTRTFAMAPVSAFFKESDFDGYNKERSIEFNSWKIPSAENAGLAYSKRIAFSDYDHYFHVNNTKYADFLLDTFAPEELKGKFFSEIQITFVKQCKAGETLDLYRQSDGKTTVVEGRVGDELRVQFKVQTDEI